MLSLVKWFSGSFLLTLPFSATLWISSEPVFDVRGATSESLSRFETRVSGIATSVHRRFAARWEPQPIGSVFRASDPRHLQLRDRFLVEHFERPGLHYRCRVARDGVPFSCEFRKLKLEGPFATGVNGGDQALGITARLFYRFRAEAYRLYTDGHRWSEWSSGLPPELSTLELIRHDTGWSVEPATSLLPAREPTR